MTSNNVYYEVGFCRVHDKHVWISAPCVTGYSNFTCPLCGEIMTKAMADAHEFDPRQELMDKLQDLGIIVYR